MATSISTWGMLGLLLLCWWQLNPGQPRFDEART
jgi:hypothetical protein